MHAGHHHLITSKPVGKRKIVVGRTYVTLCPDIEAGLATKSDHREVAVELLVTNFCRSCRRDGTSATYGGRDALGLLIVYQCMSRGKGKERK